MKGSTSASTATPASATSQIASAAVSTKSKKRKAGAEAVKEDSRFAFSAEDLLDDEDASHNDDEADATEEGDALAGDLASPSTSAGGAGLPAHLLPKSKKNGTPGLIYLSRIPPGMGPFKVKHILSAHGEVGRVFLARSGQSLFSLFFLVAVHLSELRVDGSNSRRGANAIAKLNRSRSTPNKQQEATERETSRAQIRRGLGRIRRQASGAIGGRVAECQCDR